MKFFNYFYEELGLIFVKYLDNDKYFWELLKHRSPDFFLNILT
jgi:hypothetical protein